MSSNTASAIRVQNRQTSLNESSIDGQVRLFFLESKPSQNSPIKAPLLLIHGFPESSHQFRHVIGPLAEAGYHVIAPDYRGHGFSSRPISTTKDFTKRALAADLHTLLTEHMGIKEPVHVVGHDIGGMIAHAYAAQFPADVASVIWGECPLPGSSIYEASKHSTLMWHFDFQSHRPELAAALVAGKERLYLKDFYDRLGQNQAAFPPEVVDFYAMQYAQPDALRCGFLSYRAFEQDAADNREWREKNGKVTVRNLILNGGGSFTSKEDAEKMAGEFYEGVRVGTVPEAGHWIAEENPQGFVEQVLGFVGGAGK